MHTSANPNDVPLLWTQPPKFIQIMRSGSSFQHPQYFFSQCDKLSVLLSRLMGDITMDGQSHDHVRAFEALSRLLSESQAFSSLTREQLRRLESHVRAFVVEIQKVDTLVVEWDERERSRNLKSVTKKRVRDVDDEDDFCHAPKRRTTICSKELTRLESAFDGSFSTCDPWTNNATPQPTVWTVPLSNSL